MKQYITFDKDEFERNLESIRYRMYFLDSEIRVLEEFGTGQRIPTGMDAEYWKKNAKSLSHDMRANFESIRESMGRFGSNIDFDFEGARKRARENTRNVLVEKTT